MLKKCTHLVWVITEAIFDYQSSEGWQYIRVIKGDTNYVPNLSHKARIIRMFIKIGYYKCVMRYFPCTGYVSYHLLMQVYFFRLKKQIAENIIFIQHSEAFIILIFYRAKRVCQGYLFYYVQKMWISGRSRPLKVSFLVDWS